MTKKIESLIEKCKSINPFGERILVHPDKLRTYKEMQTFSTHVSLNDMASTDSTGVVEPQEVEVEQREVVINKRYQTATVLKVPETEDRFNVGDTIIYRVGSAFDFDLIKGVSVLQKYNITAGQINIA